MYVGVCVWAPNATKKKKTQAALHGKTVEDLRRLLKKYVGTHRFLNFAGRLSQPNKGVYMWSGRNLTPRGFVCRVVSNARTLRKRTP